MGPIGFDQRFKPGTLVVINPSTMTHHKNRRDFGTIIDNFVDINLDTGCRTEKVFVMWPDADTEWLHLYQILLVPSDEP